ncbi:MAG: hypothetical protein KJT03_12820, partial [Verrucomicrobiae bacterium]|nr:hypothetical protein [Verrucomicrobiae bacterium]
MHLPWRRRDANPETKRVVVVDAASGETLDHVRVLQAGPEAADILFKPGEKAGTYHVYYFPFETTGGYYPTVTYLKPENSGDPAWLERYGDVDEATLHALPRAEVKSFQSVNDFHRFFPMEVAATESELTTFLAAYPADYYTFPEYRELPVRMKSKLPQHWVTRELKTGIKDSLKRGEYYAFQWAVFASDRDLRNLSLSYSDLVSQEGGRIGKEQFSCINLGGVDLNGKPFTKQVDVAQGSIQALWIGLQVPRKATPGDYTGTVTLRPEGLAASTLNLAFTVDASVLEDGGDSRPELMSRLRWLNSTLGSEADFIIDPFIPVTAEEHTLHILGREVDLAASGLPGAARSFFKPEMTGLKDTGEPVLADSVTFEVVRDTGKVTWQNDAYEVKETSPGRSEWTVRSRAPDFSLQLDGALEYDGILVCDLTLTAERKVDVRNVRLNVPMEKDAARYLLGLGYKGTRRPESIDWKWEVTHHQEGVWLGNVHKGLQYVLRDDTYQRPLNTNFYRSQPLRMPDGWFNGGKGGIRISETDGVVLCENYSGPRTLEAGQSLNFQVRFLLTPFKPLDTPTHFRTRFVHKYVPVDEVIADGGTVVNVHHANEINPYINYPFYHLEQQKAYIDEAHRKGVKVKLYDTIRELTYRCYELFPLRSLGFEVFNDGEGGGHPWLQEHLENDYHKAWHAWRVNDAAILDKGTSRWTNYYIEGLNWLAKNQKIDGLYLDDIAFSRETVKRMVSVLNRHRDEVIIDLHSANQFNERDGFINSAFLYMEHFPYVSRLWFGEYFEYDRDPDYWLTEVSGIPFGLMGEMLEGGGHPYRGMVYGMTTRVYQDYSPKPIWDLFDAFGIDQSEMIGYWVESVPVKTGNLLVPATAYLKKDGLLVALGSWS